MKSKVLCTKYFFAVLSLGLVLQASFLPLLPTPVAAAPVDDAAKNFCKDISVAQGSCEEGYKTGYEKSSQGTTNVDDVCGTLPTATSGRAGGASPQVIAKHQGCVQGVQDGKSTGDADNKKSAESACKGTGLEGTYLTICNDAYVAARAGQSKDDVCGSSKFVDGSESQKACEKGFGLGEAEGGKKPKDQVDCDTKLSSILSWIACPVIDMGVAMTDKVFEGFVKPMLESVPVSTNPKDGSYIAWSQFRLIANVLLVATLLAIVYSQARSK